MERKTFPFLPTYRQHNLFLLLAGIALLAIIYTFSIKRTLKVYHSYQQNKANIAKAASAAIDIENYQKEWHILQQTSQQTYNREYLLAQLTGFCREHDLLIKTFPQAKRQEKNKIPIYTNLVEVEGKYKDMVKLAFMIEQEQHLAAIASLKFYTIKDRLSKKTYLRAKIILRNLGA